MIKIEKLKDEQLEDLFGLICTAFHELNTRYALTKEDVKLYLDQANDEDSFGRALTFPEGDHTIVVGFIIAHKAKYTPSVSIEHFYVHPKARGTLQSIKLLKLCERWAKEQGAQVIHLGGMFSVGDDAAYALGFEHKSQFYTKEL